MKKIMCLALVCIIAISMVSCYFDYDGDYPELYTVAVNNVFGVDGYKSNGEVSYDPDIVVVETDDYGRVLFIYSEYDPNGSAGDWGVAFVIMQKHEDDYVYYYQDACYTPYCGGIEVYAIRQYDDIKDNVDTKMLEELKKNNDWNKPFDKTKCVRAKVNAEMPEGKTGLRDYDFDEVVIPYAKAHGYTGTDNSHSRKATFCNADKYGRELYYVYASTGDKNEEESNIYGYYHYAVIVNPDGSFPEGCVVEITGNSFESYEVVKNLKETCDWNQPIE